MKKKYVVIFSVLIILLVVIYICIPKTKEEVSDSVDEIPRVNTSGFLTLMLEQNDGSYQKSTSNSWPGDGYAFNSELSGCERGGELVFDRETNIVKLISSGSDKCYVYFDKYNVAKIANVTNTKTTNSVTLTVTTEAGENPIDKYYFSKDNGQSYQESSTNTYTFSNLNYGTTYTFKVYAKDTLGYETNEETVQVTTNAYVNPTVNNVTTSNVTMSSITLNVTASAGTSNITTYYYSKDNGSSYVSSTSNSYTFSGLSAGTTYNFKIYVKDSEGYSSNEYSKSAATNAYVNPTVNSIKVTSKTTNTISIRVSASGGTNSVATYYYSINNGAYSSSTSNTKTFTGLSMGTTYTIKIYVTDTNGISSSVKTTSVQTESGTLLADYIKGLYTSQGSNGIYYHTSSLANSAADNSYRYAGSNPNNYVCFGSDATTCPSNNLYRIIGVFGSEVKLIKATSYGNFSWDIDANNRWSDSSIRTTLNSGFLSTLNSTWQNKIATHRWKVGGMDVNYNYTSKQYYDVEVGNSSSYTTDSIKIGLMYVSDYGFAASNSYWTTTLNNYDSAVGSNWLYRDVDQWTISRDSLYSDSVFYVHSTGFIHGYNSPTASAVASPAFYLTSSTIYVSGSGKNSDPIRIN